MKFEDVLEELNEKVNFFKISPNELYHVTKSRNVKSIQKKGIIPRERPEYQGSWGQDIRMKKDVVYAFETFGSAYAFAHRFAWDGKTKMSILTFKKSGKWAEDKHWEAQMAKPTGRWLYRKGEIPPEDIIKVEPFDIKMAKDFIKQRDAKEKK